MNWPIEANAGFTLRNKVSTESCVMDMGSSAIKRQQKMCGKEHVDRKEWSCNRSMRSSLKIKSTWFLSATWTNQCERCLWNGCPNDGFFDVHKRTSRERRGSQRRPSLESMDVTRDETKRFNLSSFKCFLSRL